MSDLLRDQISIQDSDYYFVHALVESTFDQIIVTVRD